MNIQTCAGTYCRIQHHILEQEQVSHQFPGLYVLLSSILGKPASDTLTTPRTTNQIPMGHGCNVSRSTFRLVNCHPPIDTFDHFIASLNTQALIFYTASRSSLCITHSRLSSLCSITSSAIALLICQQDLPSFFNICLHRHAHPVPLSDSKLLMTRRYYPQLHSQVLASCADMQMAYLQKVTGLYTSRGLSSS